MDAKLEAKYLLSTKVAHTIHYFLNKILINLMENNVVISFIKSEIISFLFNDKTASFPSNTAHLEVLGVKESIA